jgi:hypothetical protein
VLFRAVLIYEKLGERTEAFAWLRKAMENDYSRGVVERSPELRELRADPQYLLMVESIGK